MTATKSVSEDFAGMVFPDVTSGDEQIREPSGSPALAGLTASFRAVILNIIKEVTYKIF